MPRVVMRGPLATLAATVAVGLVVGLAAPHLATAPTATGTRPAHEPRAVEPDRADSAPLAPADSERDALLWERLGGLASLVLPADPLVEACAEPDSAAAGEDDDVGAVTATTEALRGLALEEPVDVRLVDADELAGEVIERFAGRADPARIDVDERVLTALGAIDGDTDLSELRLHAFAEQISGLHAGDDGVLFLRVDDPPELSPLERVVLAHEVEHALTYQRLGRPADHRDDREHADARRASLAVVEGSATLVMLQYARTVLDDAERNVLRGQLLERAEEGALARYTPYLLSELRFPYTEGLRFACTRWLEGGWRAVGEAYTEPPESTAEILFPERQGREPDAPRALGTLDGPWERVHTTTFGAAELGWLLSAPGGDPGAALDDVRARASAWDGGRLVLWTHGQASAIGIALVDAGAGDVPRLCDTVRDWYAAAFPAAAHERADGLRTFPGPDQDAALACDAGEVRLGIAPTLEEAAALVAAAPPPAVAEGDRR